MPIYEFYCKQTHTIYSFLSQRLIDADEVPKCPDDARYKLERMVSVFSVTGRHKERDESGEGPDLDDPRMEAAMAELEGEMSGIDEENPDPRQMGRLMRRMSELTGEPLGGQMEEMVRKMEEGTDLDALEEDFGDAMDDDGLDPPEEGAPAGKAAIRRLLQARRKEPRKDPTLYDWRDYS
ncbi:FmdB family zinc ribbon protein [Puniceicoccus vermicola]|uniref:Cytochrome C n=1 Tax=Puniceicoccus vermicola TaxID=388746 RepID=A0A7X1AVG4_9BACT|nr:cytochrome C [Puniceicoccus vermicola]MBC2600743.1 cytochrome C [Puniceicoccus vermicola]